MRSGPRDVNAPLIRRVWVFAGFAVLVLTWGGVVQLPGQSAATAKPEQTGAQPAQTAAKPAQFTVKPTQATTQQPQTTVNPVQTETQSMPVTANSATGETPQAGAAGGGDAQTQPIVQEAADLLKMATDLQAEINKTKVATLSLVVVRKASEIEKLAKKMRSQP